MDRSKGEERFAWVVDNKYQSGKRRLMTFKPKKEADVFALTADVETRDGTHVPDHCSNFIAVFCKVRPEKRSQDGI